MNDLILEIMKVTLEKNRRDKNTIFIDFSGHCNLLEVYVHKNGWKQERDRDYDINIYLDSKDSNKTQKELEETINYLKNLED